VDSGTFINILSASIM